MMWKLPLLSKIKADQPSILIRVLRTQNLIAALVARFGGADPRFAFLDAPSLAADSGPTTAAGVLLFKIMGLIIVGG